MIDWYIRYLENEGIERKEGCQGLCRYLYGKDVVIERHAENELLEMPRWKFISQPCMNWNSNHKFIHTNNFIAKQETFTKRRIMMLPTPSTSHLNFTNIYEPAEDSYLLLDTLSSPAETQFLTARFPSSSSPCPLILEIGTGSGVVLSFLHSNAEIIFGRQDILTAGVDINPFACKATGSTISVAEKERAEGGGLRHGFYLGNVLGDLCTPLRRGEVDVLVFNPPYVPTPDVPVVDGEVGGEMKEETTFEEDSKFLELSYAGGKDGMEITEKLLGMVPQVLSRRGIAYILLCAQNKPEDVKKGIGGWGEGWRVETVGLSGKKGGWEKLSIIRIWKDMV